MPHICYLMNVIQVTAYHGTYHLNLPKRATSFGGFHAGTFEAALERLLDIFPSTGGGSAGHPKTGYIFPVRLTMLQPYGSLNSPVSETELAVVIGLNQIPVLQENGIDGIIYENIVEDRGSISFLVFNMDQVEQSGDPFLVNDIQKLYEERFL